MNLNEIGEFGLIARWQEKLKQRAGVRLSIGDDAAVLDSLSSPVVTCDAMVENVHFRLDWSTPCQLGRKAIAVNVSDIAAMGGKPVAAFIMLGISPNLSTKFLDELYQGFEDAASEYSVTIAGGDITRSPVLTLGITIIGEALNPITRSGALADDVLIVTGTLGDSAAGLALLKNPHLEIAATTRDYLLHRHFEPTARLREMNAALEINDAVHAALDLSDGLAGDAAHVSARSGVTLEIETARVPISEECRAAAKVLNHDALDWALRGGEDYELLLCVAPDKVEEVVQAIADNGTAATIIGRCVKPDEAPVVLINESGQRMIAPSAFRHF